MHTGVEREFVRQLVQVAARRAVGEDYVILGGMSANLCVESHLRELLEQGFEVAARKIMNKVFHLHP